MTLADGTMQGRVVIRTGATTEVVVKTIIIPPGGTTGWHYHPGRLIAVVQSGTLTRFEADCRPRVYPTGSALVEPSGPREVHLGRNLGSTPVALFATYLNPVGGPLAVPAANPGCPVS
ncbi:MAG: cupin domain-containing protein [Actinoallomurus sp.]